MTHLKQNKRFTDLFRLFGKDSYISINLILAGVLMIIFIYSGIFSPEKNNYPVVCIHEKLTGRPCFSCGLSHSFSLIVRGRLAEASEWNIYGMRVFIFFAAQLILRISFSMYYIRNRSLLKHYVIIDSTGSVLLFLLAFYPFLLNLLQQLLTL